MNRIENGERNGVGSSVDRPDNEMGVDNPEFTKITNEGAKILRLALDEVLPKMSDRLNKWCIKLQAEAS